MDQTHKTMSTWSATGPRHEWSVLRLQNKRSYKLPPLLLTHRKQTAHSGNRKLEQTLCCHEMRRITFAQRFRCRSKSNLLLLPITATLFGDRTAEFSQCGSCPCKRSDSRAAAVQRPLSYETTPLSSRAKKKVGDKTAPPVVELPFQLD